MGIKRVTTSGHCQERLSELFANLHTLLNFIDIPDTEYKRRCRKCYTQKGDVVAHQEGCWYGYSRKNRDSAFGYSYRIRARGPELRDELLDFETPDGEL